MPPLGPCGVPATMHAPPPFLLVGMRCWQLTAADCCGCCWLLLLGCAVGGYPGAMKEGTKCATAQHLQHYKTKLNGGCAPYKLPAATLQQHRAVCRPLFELRARASSPWDGCVPWVCRITQELPPASSCTAAATATSSAQLLEAKEPCLCPCQHTAPLPAAAPVHRLMLRTRCCGPWVNGCSAQCNAPPVPAAPRE